MQNTRLQLFYLKATVVMQDDSMSVFDFDELDDIFESEYLNLETIDATWDISDNSLNSDDGDHDRQRQKRKLADMQQSYKLRRPRIVKSDFRRIFPQIWAGVFNSTNYETMRSHISTFYDQSVCISQQDHRPGSYFYRLLFDYYC